MGFQGEIGIENYTHIPSMWRSTDWSLVDVNWPNIELVQVFCRAEDEIFGFVTI